MTHPVRAVLWSLAAAVLAAETAVAQFDFAGETISRDFSWDIDLADLDGDGDLDTIVSKPFPGAGLTVYLNDGTGSFANPSTYDVGDWGEAADVGDLDGDGDLDIAVLTSQLVYSITVLTNDGSGQFTVSTVSGVTLNCESIALGDLDGDGDLDALLSEWSTGALVVFEGDGTGGFSNETVLPVSGGNCFDVQALDLDSDGDLEVALACYGGGVPVNGGRLHIFDGPGDGTFNAPTTYQVHKGTWALDYGDMDGDGDIDLLTTNRNVDSVSVFLNDSTGQFANQQTTTVGSFPVDGHLADFDGDGDLDVMVPSNSSFDIHILENDGSAGLSTALIIPTTHTFYCAEAGDLNGDGAPDLLAGGSAGLDYYINVGVAPSPWLDLGNALPGSNGEPVLVGSGSLTAGSVTELALTNSVPSGAAYLVAGFAQLATPLKGGILVPTPEQITSVTLDGAGGLALAGNWPLGLPSGTQLFLQYWIVDAAGPVGFAASNGVVGTTP